MQFTSSSLFLSPLSKLMFFLSCCSCSLLLFYMLEYTLYMRYKMRKKNDQLKRKAGKRPVPFLYSSVRLAPSLAPFLKSEKYVFHRVSQDIFFKKQQQHPSRKTFIFFLASLLFMQFYKIFRLIFFYFLFFVRSLRFQSSIFNVYI